MDTTAFLRWLQGIVAGGTANCRQYIIRFDNSADFHALALALAEGSASCPELLAVRQLELIEAFRCPLPPGTQLPPSAGGALLEPDEQVQVHAVVHKPASWERGIPWGVQQVKAPQAWGTTTGHRVKVGVIDTGVDFSHPDLQNSLARGINLLSRHMMPHDDNGHGTHIAGTIAASNQLKGMIGVAPRAIIYPVKAFDHNGSAYVSDIVLAIDWCVRNRINVINMSFGMKTRSKALLTAVINAYNAGVIIVASSGNDSKRKSIDYPARYPQTVSVGATNKLRRIASFSNRGTYVDIFAPGDKIISAWLRGKYNEMSGTSMATSHVSGAVALLLSSQPSLSPSDIKAILRRSMIPLRGAKAPRKAGELDISKMLQAADK